MHNESPNPADPAEYRPLFAAASESVLRGALIGTAGIAVLLLWFDHSRLGLIAIASAVVLVAALRLNRGTHQRVGFILAVLAVAGLGSCLDFRLGWSGACAWPLLGLASSVPLNRRWDHNFSIGLGSLLVAAAAYFIIDGLLHPPEAHPMFVIVASMWFVIAAVVAARTALVVRAAEAQAAQMLRVARTDLLTGLLDRSAMNETLGYEAARTNRSQRAFSLVVAGVDGFGGLCENYGERCGDWVLITVANLLNRVLRQQDHVARWAEDQFMLLLPETEAAGGRTAAERIAAEIERSSYLFDDREIDFALTFAVVDFDGSRSLASCLEDLDTALTTDNAPGFVPIDRTE